MSVSIIIPTFNRAAILANCLRQLPDIDAEVIVSDNASADDTPQVVRAAMFEDKRIRYTALPANLGVEANIRNAATHSTGELLVYLADDDNLGRDELIRCLNSMEEDRGLVATYHDHVCWDAKEGKELHRYFPPDFATIEFDPTTSLGLVNFLLETHIPPEIKIVRRDAFLATEVPRAGANEFHTQAYNLCRLGRVRFSPDAYYRENWILPEGLARDYWNNQTSYDYVGDAQRLGLEGMLHLAIHDHGSMMFNIARARAQIEMILVSRSILDMQRAAASGNFIRAVELRRRQALNDIPAPPGFDDALAEAAAKQAFEMYDGDGDGPTMEQLEWSYRI